MSDLWTEEEYFAFAEPYHRTELVHGFLWLCSVPTNAHQSISLRLATLLLGAKPADLRVAERISVLLGAIGRALPDLVVGRWDRLAKFAEVDQVALIGEVTSPGNVQSDREDKRDVYARAGIPWYLLVEPDFRHGESISLRLLRLDGDEYIEHATAERGETLTSELPFPLAINTEWLLDF